MRLILVALAAALLTACGGKPPVPKRLVVEGDLGTWKFRRFQGPLLDYEVWIEGNKGEKYSASYITNDSEKRGHIEDKDLVNVTVTRYARTDGVVRETVKLVRRLAQERGYQVSEKKIEGVRALTIVGPSEMWAIWPSGTYIVMVGGQGRETVPDSMVEKYGERYPSQLPGGSLEGPLPPGPEDKPKASHDKEDYDPRNPRPDIDKYDPDKVKIPEQHVDDAAPDDDAAAPPATKKKKPKKNKP
ncbi:MAG: hypothetical protein H6Q90_925 [Deltaproteobacteria bacterium]|nr:hypothetical protein [Deltaproteobacteria bacterium]